MKAQRSGGAKIGVGIDEAKVAGGFGTHSVAELARLVKGSISWGAAAESDERPGTKWRLEFPRQRDKTKP